MYYTLLFICLISLNTVIFLRKKYTTNLKKLVVRNLIGNIKGTAWSVASYNNSYFLFMTW